MTFQPSMALSGIIAVQSLNIKPYNDTFDGFEKACRCGVKRYIVSESGKTDIIRKIRGSGADMLLTIGAEALDTVKSIRDIPVVYTMVLDPGAVVSNETNITGISMKISAERQLESLMDALPGAKNIGLLYDPARTGHFVKKARAAASEMKVGLVAKDIRSSKEFPELLKSMKEEIDVFWMLPDITAVTPVTVEFLFLFSIENRIPVVAFADKYLEMGALLSIDIDAADIGTQAWEMTRKILSGTAVANIQPAEARKASITFNMKIAEKLEITKKLAIKQR